ncbi:hypothetical protein EV385_3508 [Krasilnikovia cinnamomea]|uniref:Uncharacterized protein n=1 Tax=Krasilnikovia cinnamomea TaxID=349313 RepID=A0A4Q7ZMT7_9ACTN|nr:DUF6232 family protein [Krasilnikovia cinnamomea]RZU51675.1 hypothetical protein EV385_3508 [Krasilnikovia cinnamomea]
MSTRTYYRGPDAVITDEHFVWRTTSARVFEIRDLRQVHRVSGKPAHPYAIVAGGAVLLTSVGWAALTTPPAYMLGLLTVAAAGALAVTINRTRSRTWRLEATYRGRDVVLYTQSDPRVFNQVSRGLRRAMEAARPPTAGYGLVVT